MCAYPHVCSHWQTYDIEKRQFGEELVKDSCAYPLFVFLKKHVYFNHQFVKIYLWNLTNLGQRDYRVTIPGPSWARVSKLYTNKHNYAQTHLYKQFLNGVCRHASAKLNKYTVNSQFLFYLLIMLKKMLCVPNVLPFENRFLKLAKSLFLDKVIVRTQHLRQKELI